MPGRRISAGRLLQKVSSVQSSGLLRQWAASQHDGPLEAALTVSVSLPIVGGRSHLYEGLPTGVLHQGHRVPVLGGFTYEQLLGSPGPDDAATPLPDHFGRRVPVLAIRGASGIATGCAPPLELEKIQHDRRTLVRGVDEPFELRGVRHDGHCSSSTTEAISQAKARLSLAWDRPSWRRKWSQDSNEAAASKASSRISLNSGKAWEICRRSARRDSAIIPAITGLSASRRVAALRTTEISSYTEQRCSTSASILDLTGTSGSMRCKRFQCRCCWIWAAVAISDSMSAKWWYTELGATPARSATWWAVGHVAFSSIRAIAAPAMASAFRSPR